MAQMMFLERDSSMSVPQMDKLAKVFVGDMESTSQLYAIHHSETPQHRVLSETSTVTSTKLITQTLP